MVTGTSGDGAADEAVPSDLDVVRRAFTAVSDGDLKALLDCYAPTVEIEECAGLPYGGTHTGPAGAIRHATIFAKTWPHHRLIGADGVAPRFIDTGTGTVVVIFRHWAQNRDTGAVVDSPEIGIYRVANGAITHLQMFHFDIALLTDFLRPVENNLQKSPDY